jgi:hypothetical protein
VNSRKKLIFIVVILGGLLIFYYFYKNSFISMGSNDKKILENIQYEQKIEKEIKDECNIGQIKVYLKEPKQIKKKMVSIVLSDKGDISKVDKIVEILKNDISGLDENNILITNNNGDILFPTNIN